MKSFVILLATALILLLPFSSNGQSVIPHIKGTWVGDFAGVRSQPPGEEGPNPKAHHDPGVTRVQGMRFVITMQDGHVFSGTLASEKTQENFVGVIHYDNTTLYIADQDGLMFGELVNPDEIRLIYLETTRHGQVASRGTLKRQKVRWGNS